jgi:hypothetical protein
MATDRRLKAALLDRLRVTPQRLSQLVAQIKRNYGPMTTAEATYVLAHQRGLDITRYLDSAQVDRVRSMLPRGVAPVQTEAGAKVRPQPARPLRIAPKLEVVDALLSETVAGDLAAMADLYPRMYIFENSVRSVIVRVLASVHGRDWWDACAPTDVKNKVRDRKRDEARKPWHGKRNSHEIYYSDFGDLRRMIIGNWDAFQAIFPNQPWITQRLDELEAPRNVLAHHNPVAKRDRTRIELYFDDWISLLNDRREAIP